VEWGSEGIWGVGTEGVVWSGCEECEEGQWGEKFFWGPGERARVCGQSGGRGVGELQFKFTFMTDRTGGRRPPRRGGGGWEVGLGKCVETGVLLCEVEWLVVGWEIFF